MISIRKENRARHQFTYLIHISTRVGRKRSELRNEILSHLALTLQHESIVIPLPGGGQSSINQGLAPSREDRVVDISRHLLRDVQADTDEGAARLGDLTVGSQQGGVVVLNDRSRDQPASILGSANLDDTLHILELAVVALVLLGNRGVLDAEIVKAVSEGLEERHQVSNRDVRTGDWSNREAGVGKVPDAHSTCVDDSGQRGVEGLDGAVEGILRDTVIGVGQVQARDGSSGVSLRGQGPDDTVSASTTAAKSPEDIGVLIVTGSSDEVTLAINDLPFQDLIGGQAVAGAECRVTTTLGVATGKTDGGTFTANDLVAGLLGKLVGFVTLNSSAHGNGLSGVVRITVGVD